MKVGASCVFLGVPPDCDVWGVWGVHEPWGAFPGLFTLEGRHPGRFGLSTRGKRRWVPGVPVKSEL